MKPIIIEKNSDGKINITAEEISKMVEDAYNQGYADGKSTYTPVIINPIYERPYWNWVTTTSPVVTLGSDSVSVPADKITI